MNIGDNKLDPPHGLAYGLPIVVTYFLFYPVQVLLSGIYAKYFGLALSTIATIVFFARLFDAVSDPLIGYLSDRYRAKSGTRKPWLVTGSLCLVISSYFLWVPPENVGACYFLGWYFAFYLAWTITDVPHMAWGSELSSCSIEKTRIFSLRATCVYLGLILYTLVPLLPFFSGQGFTPATLQWSVLASAIVIIPALMVCIKITPDGRPSALPDKESPRLLINTLIQNKPLLILTAGFFLINLAYGMCLGLLFIFADSYLYIGQQLPLAFTMSVFAGLLAAGLVYKLAERIAKTKIYIFSVVLSAMTFASLAFVQPSKSAMVLFTTLISIVTFCNAIILSVVPSILSDIADYGSWKFQADRTATYFSIYTFVTKAVVGIGGALSLGLTGWYGFDIATVSHAENSIIGLRLGIGIIPALLMFVSLIFVAINPISIHRHNIIQRRLASRAERKIRPPHTDTQSNISSPNIILIGDQ